jgi:preprotein translocase subunit SecD
MPQKLLSPLVALLLMLSAALACTSIFKRQDSQDKGGIFLVIAVKATGAQLDESIARTISVIESRCNQLAIYCKLERQGGDHVMLRVSSGMTPERIKAILLSEGLEMRAVASRPSPGLLESYATQAEAATAAGTDKDVMPYKEAEQGSPNEKRKFVVVERAPIVTGEDVRDAKPMLVSDNYEVVFSLKPEGAAKLQAWTRANINKYIAIILNKEARTIAYIRSEISDSGVITGRYTKEQAEDVAHVLVTGNLPAPVELVREGTYKP